MSERPGRQSSMKKLAVVVLLVVAGCGSSKGIVAKKVTATTAPTTSSTSAGQPADPVTSAPDAPVTDAYGDTLPSAPDLSTDSTTTTTDTTVAPPPKLKVGETVTFENSTTLQVFSYQQPVQSSDQYTHPDAGMEYGLADVQFCASPTALISYNSFGFKAQMADNRSYDSTSGVRTPDVGSGDIPAGGGCVRGFVGFALPIGQRPVSIVWDYPGYQRQSFKL